MNVQEKIKEVDAELIRLIIAGEFELVGIAETITTIMVGGVKLNFSMANGESYIRTYHNNCFLGMDHEDCYAIQNMTNKRGVYRALKKLRDPKQEAKILNEKREQLKRLKKELGE